jgi:TolB-like protein/Flp pilus assembly protein TadD
MPSLPFSTNAQTSDRSQAELALQKVLGSQTFSDMPRLKRFLEYVVTETIAGRGDRLKGVVIACDVFDKTDPDEAQSTTIVRVEAGRLRRRLNDYYQREGSDETFRIRIPKGGYIVVFEEMAESSAPAGKTDKSKNQFTIRNIALALVVLFSLIAFWNYYTSNPEGQAVIPPATPVVSKPIIAVLPFNNMVSNDPDGSIAYGLTEDIITDLGSLVTLEVISMTSVLPFTGLDVSPPDISSKLGAHYILKGSVRGIPPELRVTAQLYDAINSVQLWAKRFDRQMSNELVLQNELALEVVDSLSIHLQGDENFFPAQRHNTDMDTWTLYKQAMNLVNPPSDPARLELSLQAFTQICQHDPNFAGGFAGLAYVHAFKAFFGHSQSTDIDIHAALDMAETAQTLDPSFGLSYTAQAFAYLIKRDFEQALAASARAIQLAPNDSYVAAYHGFILSASGNSQEGIAYATTALRLDPLNARTPYLNILGTINLQAGNYEEALSAFARSRDRGGPMGPGIHYLVAAAYAGIGDIANANATLKAADMLGDESSDWAEWVKRSWKNQEDTDHILRLIQQTRNGGLQP